MKREDLIKLGIADEVVDKVMALHGADIETHKTRLTAAQTELDGLKAQLGEANNQIEAFRGMDVDGIRRAADEWKAKAEQAEVDAKKQLDDLRFNHALDGALSGAKAKNAKAVRALLDLAGMKLNDDGSIVGLTEQLENIKTENGYLFEDDQPTPRIVSGGQPKTVIGDPVILAARRAAGLSTKGEK